MKILFKKRKVGCRNSNTWSQSANTFRIKDYHSTWFHREFLLLLLCNCHVENVLLHFFLFFISFDSSHNCIPFWVVWLAFWINFILHTIDQRSFYMLGSRWFDYDLTWPRNQISWKLDDVFEYVQGLTDSNKFLLSRVHVGTDSFQFKTKFLHGNIVTLSFYTLLKWSYPV